MGLQFGLDCVSRCLCCVGLQRGLFSVLDLLVAVAVWLVCGLIVLGWFCCGCFSVVGLCVTWWLRLVAGYFDDCVGFWVELLFCLVYFTVCGCVWCCFSGFSGFGFSFVGDLWRLVWVDWFAFCLVGYL